MAEAPPIRAEGLRKAFGGTPVLDGVDLEVARGESLVVIGGSGTGKSVLLKCILGLEVPDAGRVWLRGQDATGRAPPGFLDRFGMLFQGGALFDSLTVWQNVAFRLLRGPGRLAQAFGLDGSWSGVALADTPLDLHDDGLRPAVTAGPRVGIAEAADWPWRFAVAGSPWVSRYVRSPRAPARAG